jgi:hypothetical protein
MRLMFPAERAELFQLDALGSRALILRFAVIPILALAALKLNNLSRHSTPLFTK